MKNLILKASRYSNIFWNEWKLNPGTYSNFVTFAYNIEGNLDTERLLNSLRRFVAKNAWLRSYFHAENNTLYQSFKETIDSGIFYKKTSSFPNPKACDDYIKKQLKEPFDLTKPPLFRFILLEKSENAFSLYLIINHILIDGNCDRGVVKGIEHLYNNFENEDDAPDNSHIERLSDFIKNDTDNIDKDNQKEGLKYWKDLIGDTSLYTEFPYTENVKGDFYSSDFIINELDEELSKKLVDYSNDKRYSLFQIMTAAWCILVYKYTRNKKFILGYPVNMRPKEFKDFAGALLNTVPWVIDLDTQETIVSMMEKMKKQRRCSREYQMILIADIIAEVSKNKDFESHSILNMSVAFAEFPHNIDFLLNGVKCIPQARYNIGVGELALIVEPGTCFTMMINYRKDLFSNDFIAECLEHYKRIIAEIASGKDRVLSDINILSESNYKTLIYDWNSAVAPYSKDKTVQQIFEEQAEKTPDNIAVIFEDTRVTYKELNEKANQLAHTLRRDYKEFFGEDIKKDTLLGLYMERGIDMIVSMLGILKSGAAYVPFDVDDPEERLRYKINDCGCKIVLVSSSRMINLTFLSDSDTVPVAVDSYIDEISKASINNPDSINCSTDLAYVIYTSGSTGKPKGVMVEHKGVPNLVMCQTDSFDIDSSSRILQFASDSFDAAVSEIFTALFNGAVLVLVSSKRKKDIGSLIQLIDEEKVSVATIPPALLESFPPETKLPYLKTLVVAGDVCTQKQMDDWSNGRLLINAYGPTEATVCATIHRFNKGESNRVIGKPIKNGQIYILDEFHSPVPVGVNGEMYIGGVGLARGYLKRPDLTKERFIENPFITEEEKQNGHNLYIYKSGDLGRWLPDGNIEYIGRNDNQVKIRGFRIELGEIESQISDSDLIEQAVVRCQERDEGDRFLTAYYTPSKSHKNKGQQQDNEVFIESWQSLYDKQFVTALDADADFSGWASSFSEKDIPLNEMEEWRDSTIDRILFFKPETVYEIGCGTGLLMHPLVKHIKNYVGIDFSESTLNRVRASLASKNIQNSKVFNARADELDSSRILENIAEVDTVIVNSVAQYFPNIEYMDDVISKAAKIIKKGRIFLGDIRDYRLFNEFHSSIIVYKNLNGLLPEGTKIPDAIEQNLKNEKELLIDPGFFIECAKKYKKIKNIEIVPRRGIASHEMNRFRYDVILNIDSEESSETQTDITWTDYDIGISPAELLKSAPEYLALKSYPNSRIMNECRLTELLSESDERAISEYVRLKTEKSDIYNIEELYNLAAENKYELYITMSLKDKSCYDMVFYKNGLKQIKENINREYVNYQSPEIFTNNPVKNFQQSKISVEELRSYLLSVLPDYMVPSFFIELEKMPLNTSGKIDTKSLPKPELKADHANYVAPRNECEEKLCSIWQEELRIDKIGIEDDFFKLGGNSILAIKLAQKMSNEFNTDIDVLLILKMKNIKSIVEESGIGAPDDSEKEVFDEGVI